MEEGEVEEEALASVLRRPDWCQLTRPARSLLELSRAALMSRDDAVAVRKFGHLSYQSSCQ